MCGWPLLCPNLSTKSHAHRRQLDTSGTPLACMDSPPPLPRRAGNQTTNAERLCGNWFNNASSMEFTLSWTCRKTARRSKTDGCDFCFSELMWPESTMTVARMVGLFSVNVPYLGGLPNMFVLGRRCACNSGHVPLRGKTYISGRWRWSRELAARPHQLFCRESVAVAMQSCPENSRRLESERTTPAKGPNSAWHLLLRPCMPPTTEVSRFEGSKFSLGGGILRIGFPECRIEDRAARSQKTAHQRPNDLLIDHDDPRMRPTPTAMLVATVHGAVIHQLHPRCTKWAGASAAIRRPRRARRGVAAAWDSIQRNSESLQRSGSSILLQSQTPQWGRRPQK